MARGKLITLDQEGKVLSLYKKGVSIKEIMKDTGVKSEQTIYRLLDANNIPRRPKIKVVKYISIGLESDVSEIISNESNISYYINEAIRFYHKNNV